MINYVRSVPLHRWLRRIAIGLTLVLGPHIAIVMATDMPTPLVNTNIVATAAAVILAKLEEQAQARKASAQALAELTSAARR